MKQLNHGNERRSYMLQKRSEEVILGEKIEEIVAKKEEKGTRYNWEGKAGVKKRTEGTVGY